MSQTVYKFDILADHAEKAIDIFSNFFISPLFSISGTSREINAVDSENSKNMSNDARRRLQILKALANPNHHYSKFSTGNAKTLDISSDNNDNTDDDGDCKIENECKDSFVREAMIAFHKRHYRPDNLTVVIIGPQSLQTLQEWTVPRFATIMNRWEEGKDTNDMTKAEQIIDSVANDAPIEIFGSPSVPYDPAFDTKFQSNAWPILLTTSPLQSIRKLFMYFPLPSVKEFQDQSPYNIICHLFGHEGPGSIFAQLQDAGLIDAISVGPKLSDIDQSLLQVTIALTEKGEEQWEDVVSTVFDYCSLLHDTLNEAKNTQGKTEVKSNQAMKQMTRIWDEIQRICSLRFHQTSPGQAYALAPSLAGSVRKNGTTRCMAAGSMINENVDTVPIDNLLDFINRLVPQNCFVEHCSQSAWKKQQDIEESIEEKTETSNLFGFHTEKWYGVVYHLSAIDNDFVERWNWKNDQRKNLHLYLPAQNQYIPTDLSLCEDLPEDAIKGPRIEKDIDPPNLVVDDKIFGKFGKHHSSAFPFHCSSILSIL
jgi:insulysin